MKKISPKTAYLILGVVFVAMVIALVAQVVAEGKMTSSIAVRTLIPMGACASAFAKIYTGNTRSRGNGYYERLYEKDIAGAFVSSDRKAARRLLVKGIRDFHEDRFEKALGSLEKLPSRCVTETDFAVVWFFLGRVYSCMGLQEKGIEAYETVLSHHPNHASTWNNLGTIRMRQGDCDAAAECYRRAAMADECYVVAYNNMAQLQLRLGRWQDAIRFASHAVRLQSDFTAALNALALAYYAMGERAEGRKYADRAARHGSDRQHLETLFRMLDAGDNPFDPVVEIPSEVEEALEQFRRRNLRPMLRICPSVEGRCIGRSRVGGESVGEAPLDRCGKPMRLLAAIWCSETQGMADLPSRGILRFFIAEDRDLGCDRLSPAEQRDFRVLYTPDEDAFGACEVERVFDPHTSFPVKGCYPIEFVPGLGTPLSGDYRFRPALEEALALVGAPAVEALDPTVYRAICRQHEWGGHRMGGYPRFADIDPRCQAVYQPYDTVLLQIVGHALYFEKEGVTVDIIAFGEDGGCQFLIPRDKLRALDFSDILYWWDDIPANPSA